jgi:hypothetical protein
MVQLFSNGFRAVVVAVRGEVWGGGDSCLSWNAIALASHRGQGL